MGKRIYYKSFLYVNRARELTLSRISGGAALIGATVVAIILSNIPATSEWYHSIWHKNFTIGFEGFALSKPLEMWINDGLMAVFFFVIGLEIKREIIAGQLRTLKQASLPIAGAIGGMLIPALIYIYFNKGTITEAGWGIPMATDIAFALGILSMMSRKVPLSLKIFLTALAIVDDLGAILVIAIFYSSHIDWVMLGAAGLVLTYLILLNQFNVHKMKWYLFPSIVLWILFLNSGVHATIAGVLIAMTMPGDARYNKKFFTTKSLSLIHRFRSSDCANKGITGNECQHHIIEDLRYLARNTISPIQRLEHALHGTITFFIIPVFALANAGITLAFDDIQHLGSVQGLGIILGLVVGKPLGIMLFSYFTIKMGWSAMPSGASWRSMIAIACLGGIGFTMSIFINNLAFTDPALINYSKIAIIFASVVAATIGGIILLSSKKVKLKDRW